MTKAEQWRRKSRELAVEEAVDLPLPSGMTIRARRPGPAFLAAHGKLPLSLASRVLEEEDRVRQEPREQAEEVQAFALFLRDLLLFCVVEPSISLTPGPEQVHPRDIANEDVDYIVAWAMRGSEAGSLEAFRRKRNDGPAGSHRAEVPSAAIHAAGDPGPHDSAEFRPRRSRGTAADRARG